MVKVVGVRFRQAGKVYYFDPLDFDIKQGSNVIVETARGVEYGYVVMGSRMIEDEAVVQPLKPIIRPATEEDTKKEAENREKEKEAFKICLQKIAARELEMKLIGCEYTFDANKILFYFTADGRVDFRELVKDLASVFRTRIELRQVGVRDEAKILGGMGTCGRPLCCSCYMADFNSITTQAARCQDLSLNPQKLAGQCSKLKCCINYEASAYIDAQSKLPVVKEPLEFKDGSAWLVKTDILAGVMWFSYEKNNMTNIFPLSADRVRAIQALNRKGNKPDSLQGFRAADTDKEPETEFVSAAGDESITRFDESKRKRRRKGHRHNGRNGHKEEK